MGMHLTLLTANKIKKLKILGQPENGKYYAGNKELKTAEKKSFINLFLTNSK